MFMCCCEPRLVCGGGTNTCSRGSTYPPDPSVRNTEPFFLCKLESPTRPALLHSRAFPEEHTLLFIFHSTATSGVGVPNKRKFEAAYSGTLGFQSGYLGVSHVPTPLLSRAARASDAVQLAPVSPARKPCAVVVFALLRRPALSRSFSCLGWWCAAIGSRAAEEACNINFVREIDSTAGEPASPHGQGAQPGRARRAAAASHRRLVLFRRREGKCSEHQ